MKPFIKIDKLKKEYETGSSKILAVNDLSFTVERGEFVVIVGPSGSGKSTLLNILGGMDVPTSGEIIVDNVNIEKFTAKGLTKYRRHDIGFVFQFYNLMPNLTARENVDVAKRLVKNPMDTDEALDLVDLSHRKNHFPAELSGGEQQRVSIARALGKNPKILLCDEPTGALDSETGKHILNTLWNLCKTGGETVIIVTHNQIISETADRVIHLRNGAVSKMEINEKPLPMEEVDW